MGTSPDRTGVSRASGQHIPTSRKTAAQGRQSQILFLPTASVGAAQKAGNRVMSYPDNSGRESRETISGLVERVTFHNPESGFCVLRVKVRGHRDLVTMVGSAAMISAGEWVNASGRWHNDRTYGQQFKSDFLKASTPSSTEGIRRYLASGMIRGIGQVYAARLVKHFGPTVFDIIEEQPDRLRDVEGIGPKRASRIIESWAEQKAVREIMVFLHAHGVGTARAVRIYRTYGNDSVTVMRQNPYRLARDIRGIGFRTADTIARTLGIEITAMVRVRAGISFALTEATGQGHCALPVADLTSLAERLLEVPVSLIEDALRLEISEGTVIADTIGATDCIFLATLYSSERGIARHINRLATERLPWRRINADNALPWIESQTGLTLSQSQSKAISLALRSKILVITGGPGVGKTTIVNSILRILSAKRVKIKLCAPTGRAAKRMAETTGMEARTVHRLLEFDPTSYRFKRNEKSPLNCDLLVIDETSMIDVALMLSLLKAVPDQAAVLIVGDIDQLPSVGPGQVLADIIGSGAVPVVRLTEIFRQAASSQIIANAHRINQGRIPSLLKPETATDFYFVRADEPETAIQRIIELVRNRIPHRFDLDPIRDVQVLCPMNRGGVGARSLNIELQAVLNPFGSTKIERFGWTFAPGDKVMQVENNYDREIYNGDIGYITSLDITEQELVVDFQGHIVSLGFGDLDALVPAYAATIHKSQGSEFPAVVIPVMTQHYSLLQRNLLYTGVTRGRKLVVLVGQPKAVAIAVRNFSSRQRWSKLVEWLDPKRKPEPGTGLFS